MKSKRKIIISVIILGLISIINLYNSKYLNHFYSNYYLKQLLWYLISIMIFLFISRINVQTVFKYSNYLYYGNLLLLVLVLLIGHRINGAKAWIDLGLFTFQPSELMKISLNLYLLEICASSKKKKVKIMYLIIWTIIPSILVFLEPDTGAIIFYMLIFIVCLFYLKISYKYFFLLLLIGLFFMTSIIYLYINHQNILIHLLGTNIFYRADRIINFKTNNYQRALAMLSIFGTEIFRNGYQNILIYIPEGATDFILAFTLGNYGFLLLLVIIFLYTIFLINLTKLINNQQDKKTNYLIISFIYITFIQIMINICMNIGLIPIIGITLPFLSYGGSSLLICFIYLGIIFFLTNKDVKEHNKNTNSFHKDNKD